MRATIGDRLHIRNNHTGNPEQCGTVREVRGQDGAPPYLVEFNDGRAVLVYPGPDAVIESCQASGAEEPLRTSARKIHTRAGW